MADFLNESLLGKTDKVGEDRVDPACRDFEDTCLLGIDKQKQDDVDERCSDKNSQGSTCIQATVNCVNLLLGMGMLAVPFAVQEAGWLSLAILLAFAFICCYTGYVLSRCIDISSSVQSYPDIGQLAYGSTGRKLVITLVYMEILAYLIGCTISIGDNIARIFPNAEFNYWGIKLEGPQFLVIVANLIILPTVWMRNLGSLSYVSFGGVISSLVVVSAVAWAGVFGGVGFSHTPPLFHVWNVPFISGIYAYCYSGHIIIPNIYVSMKDRSQFPKVLVVSFCIATTIYAGLALMGSIMFGEHLTNQITLNIPRNLTVSSVALWTSVINPLSKFSLSITPVAQQLEKFLPFPYDSKAHVAIGTLIRTGILFLVLVVALALPFFDNMLALVGSSGAMFMAVILPCVFYLKLHSRNLSKLEICFNFLCIIIGVTFSVMGTVSSVMALIEQVKSRG